MPREFKNHLGESVLAVQWNGTWDDSGNVVWFCPLAYEICDLNFKRGYLYFDRKNPVMILHKNWITKNTNGEFKVLTDTEFKTLYKGN